MKRSSASADPRGRLLVLGHVGHEPLDQQPAAVQRARASAVPDRADDAVDALHPVRDLRAAAGEQLTPEARVGRAVERVARTSPTAPRTPRSSPRPTPHEALERRAREPRHVAPADRHLADVNVVVEELEDALEMVHAEELRKNGLSQWPFHNVLYERVIGTCAPVLRV